MRQILFLWALSFLAPLHSAWASKGDVESTLSWDEDVTLHSGQLWPVKRTVVITRHEWERPGRGRLTKRSIAFILNGKRVEWTNEDIWPIWYMPDILEIVDGEPVVFMPVYRWGPCNKYGFPREGLIAFRLRGEKWSQVSVGEFHQDLKVNLWRSTHAIQYSSEYQYRRIDAATKLQLEGSGVPKQGTPISELIPFYADGRESCVAMRPPPNPKLDEARQRNGDAEVNASLIQAEVVSIETKPELVTKEMVVELKGRWTGVGFLSGNCKGAVERVEPVDHWRDDGSAFLVAYQLVLPKAPIDQKKVQIPNAIRGPLQVVVCDQRTIFVVRRTDKDNLIVHRFSHRGDLIDAVRVFLPDTEKVIPGKDWAILWTAVPDDEGNLAISIIDFSNRDQPSLGGIIRRKMTYASRFPVR